MAGVPSSEPRRLVRRRGSEDGTPATHFHGVGCRPPTCRFVRGNHQASGGRQPPSAQPSQFAVRFVRGNDGGRIVTRRNRHSLPSGSFGERWDSRPRLSSLAVRFVRGLVVSRPGRDTIVTVCRPVRSGIDGVQTGDDRLSSIGKLRSKAKIIKYIVIIIIGEGFASHTHGRKGCRPGNRPALGGSP